MDQFSNYYKMEIKDKAKNDGKDLNLGLDLLGNRFGFGLDLVYIVFRFQIKGCVLCFLPVYHKPF